MTTKIAVTLSADYRVTDATFGDTSKALLKPIIDALASGNQTDQANRAYPFTGATSTGGVTFDLSGSLTDAFGNTLSLTSVQCIIIRNLSTTVGEDLIVGNGANPFATFVGASVQSFTIKEDGFIILWAPKTGYTVTAGTGDILKIASAAGTPSYELIVIGRT